MPATAGPKMLFISSATLVSWFVYNAIERKVKPASRISEPMILFSDVSTVSRLDVSL